MTSLGGAIASLYAIGYGEHEEAAHAEEGADRPLVAAALTEELRLMADWLELDDVAVTDRGDLAPELSRVGTRPLAG